MPHILFLETRHDCNLISYYIRDYFVPLNSSSSFRIFALVAKQNNDVIATKKKKHQDLLQGSPLN